MATRKTGLANQKYVALFRGMNVGGKNSVPMRELTEIFQHCGCAEVATYIQSGNVVFRARKVDLEQLPARLRAEIATRLGHKVAVVLRTAEEMQQVLQSNPFLLQGEPEKTLHVYFLEHKPGEDAIKKLDPNRSVGDGFRVVGREVYLHLPNGMARTKLTNAYFDAKLSTTSTARNWATILKLAEMARSPD